MTGGHREDGEPLDRGARRAPREETGADVEACHQESHAPSHCGSPRGGVRVGAVSVAPGRPGGPYGSGPGEHDGLFRAPTERREDDCHPRTVAVFRVLTEGPSYLAPNWMNSARGGSE
ncbi:NUDIX hydrolase [Streptomyces sp. NPDC058637]|uniref:NUDIX hydrolase n=1 Tax=Streptomyces sp. NPDC058637 TaxID=3346569 RepID=UPI003665466A